jgi:hypothetical protein
MKILITGILILISTYVSAQKRKVILCGITLPNKENGIFLDVNEYKNCDRTLTLSDTTFIVTEFTLELIPDNPNIKAISFPITNAQIPENMTSYICNQVKSIYLKNIIAINEKGKAITIPTAYIGVKIH